MSFRETRTLVERLRTLGFPRTVSIDSFRAPNFGLVAEILAWLVKSYDPSIDFPTDTSTEQDRVAFIKSIATVLAPKAHIMLSTRKLYIADGNAVRELLKVANVLYEAANSQHAGEEDPASVMPLDISSKLSSLKTARALASEITMAGANLFDLLSKELELREIRSAVLARPFEISNIQKDITDSITNLHNQLDSYKSGLDALGADEANLAAKIEKKKAELDRAQKRLRALQGVRPAWMDEYERIEVELSKLYAEYVNKFRNLTYLEQILEDHDRLEQDKMEENDASLRRMQSRLQQEELRMLRNEREFGSGSEGEIDLDEGGDNDDLGLIEEADADVHAKGPTPKLMGGVATSVQSRSRMDSRDEEDDSDIDGNRDENDDDLGGEDLSLGDDDVDIEEGMGIDGDSDNDF